MNGLAGSGPGDAWAVDEIGLAFGIVGDYRVRTTYQPVFERREGMLVPVAMTSAAVLHRGGREIGPVQGAALDLPARRLAGRLEAELAVRNASFLETDEIEPDLLVPLDGTARLDCEVIESLLAVAEEAAVSRHRLRFDISNVVASLGAPIRVDPALASLLVADVSAAGAWPVAMAGHRPGLVRLPEPAARLILEDGSTLRLLTALAGAIVRQGGMLQVEGIATPMLLRRALSAGCMRLQGDFLAPAVAAGVPLDMTPRPIGGFVDMAEQKAEA